MLVREVMWVVLDLEEELFCLRCFGICNINQCTISTKEL